MFLLVAFMLMDNILKFLSVQCTLVIPYPQVTEIVNYEKIRFYSSFNIFIELILVIFPLNLKIYYFKNIVVFSMDHPCGL